MSTKSPEYASIRSKFHDICQELGRQNASITPLANDLASDDAQLISESTRDNVTLTRGIPPYEMATSLLNAAHVTIQFQPEKFYIFTDKLKAHGFHSLAVTLLKLCESKGGRPAPNDTSESSRNEVVDLSHPSLQQPPSLPDLTNLVSPLLKHKWREIGIQLDIRPSDLDSFYDRRNRNPNNCFVDVFSAWESEAKLPYTWATILKAISSSYVDEKAIAMRIRDEIITRYNSS